MAKAYEITVWQPHAGMWSEALKNMKEVIEIFKSEGVSEVQILQGHAGKDVGSFVVIQTFKGLADNGAVNEAISKSAKMSEWMKAHGKDDYAKLVSHDLYVDAE
jgi:hypothetical protein